MQGKTINGYTLQRPLGTGGMAEVWYAENRIHKPAAVKILNLELSQNKSIVDRFSNEAEIMVKLNHPNIRQVYDYGDVDGRPAIIMEYLEGSDLKVRMKRGQRFTEAELERWWNQLVDALNYTHAQGVVHRDIKPSNIFIDEKGDVKLLDFGIAKVADTSTGTMTGSTLGTRIYMSPEQVKDPKRVDYRTDHYSLAVTFVHLLTGKAPYDSTTSSDFDIQLSIVTKPVDMDKVTDTWRDFLTPYLNKEPDQRPALKHFEKVAYKADEEEETKVEQPAPLDVDEGTVVEGTSKPDVKIDSRPKQTENQEVSPESGQKRKFKVLPWVLAGISVGTILLYWIQVYAWNEEIKWLMIYIPRLFPILAFVSIVSSIAALFFFRPKEFKSLPYIVMGIFVVLYAVQTLNIFYIEYFAFHTLVMLVPIAVLIALIILKLRKEKQYEN